MKAFFDILFGNIFRGVVAVIITYFALYYYPIDPDLGFMIAILAVAMYVVGIFYGYVAQGIFMPGKQNGAQRTASLFAWIAVLSLIVACAFGLSGSDESSLHPTSIANMCAFMTIVLWILSHALLGVIWNIATTKTIAQTTPDPRIGGNHPKKVD